MDPESGGKSLPTEPIYPQATCEPTYNMETSSSKVIKYLTHPTTQTSPLAISPQLFPSKLKTLLVRKSYLDSSFSPYLPPVSTPSTNHHSHLTVCLPDSLDLDRCLSILFWLSACE